MSKEVNGYSLFEDVQDTELRHKNRLTVLTNIISDHLDGDKVSGRGVSMFLQYLTAFEDTERKALANDLLKLFPQGAS